MAESEPAFDLNLNLSLEWDSQVDDAMLLQALNDMENEFQVNPEIIPQAEPPAPAPDPVQPSSAVPQSSGTRGTKKRHATVSEADLVQLERERDEKGTLQVTAWAVKILKGDESYF